MTRKRFVKRMMALGYSRNEAVNLAARANRYGISYADRWDYEMSLPGSLRRAARKFGKSAKNATKALRRAIITAGNTIRKFAAGIKTPNEARELLGLHIPVPHATEPVAMTKAEHDNLHGLRTHVVLADELAASGLALTPEQIKARTATWPGTTVMVGVDLANGPDIAGTIVAHVPGQGLVAHRNADEGGPISFTVAGGAENAD